MLEQRVGERVRVLDARATMRSRSRSRRDRDGVLALFGSWSALAALPDDERAETLSQLARVLDRHSVGALELSYVAQLRLYDRE